MIQLNQIKKEFGKEEARQTILKGISLDIKEGEMVSIMGPSGSGKSSLLNILGLLDGMYEGEYLLDGINVADLTEKEQAGLRGEKIGFVFQSFFLMMKQTALENVCLPLTYAGIPKRKRKEIAAQALKRVGLEDRMNYKPTQLSGGQCQRVAIARAISNHPKILLADEPTGALDSKSGAQIMELFQSLHEEGVTIIMITHDLGVVAEVCDDVAVMYCGRVVERGDVKTIFANPSHPYTKGLLGSIPRLGDAGKELKSIPGNVPNPKYMPKGCKFEPRCPYASEKCREEEPGFFQIEEGHISRCWLCESGQLKTDHVEKAGD